MIRIQTKQVISVQDWDKLVINTYGRPYSFQQQDGCKDRGMDYLMVPSEPDDYQNDTVPEVINGSEMGVSFKAWLECDPKEWNGEQEDANFIYLFWLRNFYPDAQMVANDLH